MSGVSGVTPMMNFPYNVTARAGAGGRYLYDYVQIMGIDMTQFDQMGYKLVGGEKPGQKGSGACRRMVRLWFHGHPEERRTTHQHTRRSVFLMHV